MRIVHGTEHGTDHVIENRFVAQNDIGLEIGRCDIETKKMKALFPNRPLQIHIVMDGAPKTRTVLLGAATAYAIKLIQKQESPARIYTECDPDDDAYLATLEALGYEDTDGIVRMVCLPAHRKSPVIPDGLTVLSDRLEDDKEAVYFLQRYNRLFEEAYDFSYVDELRNEPGFRRYLAIDRGGLVGEVLTTFDGHVGTIRYVYVTPAHRHKGYGTYLVRTAVAMLEMRGAEIIQSSVRVRLPRIMRLMKSAGFEQDALLLRYPGMNRVPESFSFDAQQAPDASTVADSAPAPQAEPVEKAAPAQEDLGAWYDGEPDYAESELYSAPNEEMDVPLDDFEEGISAEGKKPITFDPEDWN